MTQAAAGVLESFPVRPAAQAEPRNHASHDVAEAAQQDACAAELRAATIALLPVVSVVPLPAEALRRCTIEAI